MLVAAGKEVEMVVMLDPPTINARKSVQLLFSTMRRARPIAGPVVERAMAWTWFRCVQTSEILELSVDQTMGRDKAAMGFVEGKIAKPIDHGSDQVRAAPIVVDRSGTPILGLSLKDARTSRYAAAMSNYRPNRSPCE